MANDDELKGHTKNDTDTFFFIAIINVVILAIVMVASSGGFAAAPGGAVGVKEGGIFNWFSDGKTKWAAGERPFKDSPLMAMSAQAKEKVIHALRTMAISEQDTKTAINDDVMMNLLDAIDTPKELEEFKAALNDPKLFTQMASYLKASRAELADFFPIAFIAACFGAVMFGVFTKFAVSSAEEVVATGNEEASPAASPSNSPSKSPRPRLRARVGDGGEDFSGMDLNEDGRTTRAEARAYRATH